jgi:hypothetical protein
LRKIYTFAMLFLSLFLLAPEVLAQNQKNGTNAGGTNTSGTSIKCSPSAEIIPYGGVHTVQGDQISSYLLNPNLCLKQSSVATPGVSSVPLQFRLGAKDYCVAIDNAAASAYFIPLDKAIEWNEFVRAKPKDLTFRSACAGDTKTDRCIPSERITLMTTDTKIIEAPSPHKKKVTYQCQQPVPSGYVCGDIEIQNTIGGCSCNRNGWRDHLSSWDEVVSTDTVTRQCQNGYSGTITDTYEDFETWRCDDGVASRVDSGRRFVSSDNGNCTLQNCGSGVTLAASFDKASVVPGQNATLSWQAVGADRITANCVGPDVTVINPSMNGSRSYTISQENVCEFEVFKGTQSCAKASPRISTNAPTSVCKREGRDIVVADPVFDAPVRQGAVWSAPLMLQSNAYGIMMRCDGATNIGPSGIAPNYSGAIPVNQGTTRCTFEGYNATGTICSTKVASVSANDACNGIGQAAANFTPSQLVKPADATRLSWNATGAEAVSITCSGSLAAPYQNRREAATDARNVTVSESTSCTVTPIVAGLNCANKATTANVTVDGANCSAFTAVASFTATSATSADDIGLSYQVTGADSVTWTLVGNGQVLEQGASMAGFWPGRRYTEGAYVFNLRASKAGCGERNVVANLSVTNGTTSCRQSCENLAASGYVLMNGRCERREACSLGDIGQGRLLARAFTNTSDSNGVCTTSGDQIIENATCSSGSCTLSCASLPGYQLVNGRCEKQVSCPAGQREISKGISYRVFTSTTGSGNCPLEAADQVASMPSCEVIVGSCTKDCAAAGAGYAYNAALDRCEKQESCALGEVGTGRLLSKTFLSQSGAGACPLSAEQMIAPSSCAMPATCVDSGQQLRASGYAVCIRADIDYGRITSQGFRHEVYADNCQVCTNGVFVTSADTICRRTYTNNYTDQAASEHLTNCLNRAFGVNKWRFNE